VEDSGINLFHLLIISLTYLFGLLNTLSVAQTVDYVSQTVSSFSDRRLLSQTVDPESQTVKSVAQT